jgi:hypothetical protein
MFQRCFLLLQLALCAGIVELQDRIARLHLFTLRRHPDNPQIGDVRRSSDHDGLARHQFSATGDDDEKFAALSDSDGCFRAGRDLFRLLNRGVQNGSDGCGRN